jgi:hypothetical protein
MNLKPVQRAAQDLWEAGPRWQVWFIAGEKIGDCRGAKRIITSPVLPQLPSSLVYGEAAGVSCAAKKSADGGVSGPPDAVFLLELK